MQQISEEKLSQIKSVFGPYNKANYFYNIFSVWFIIIGCFFVGYKMFSAQTESCSWIETLCTVQSYTTGFNSDQCLGIECVPNIIVLTVSYYNKTRNSFSISKI